MKICVENKLSPESYITEKSAETDILVFGFKSIGIIKYRKELSGETDYFKQIADLSEKLNRAVLCSCDTDNYGILRRSVAVAEKGKLLGISDMSLSLNDSGVMPGGGQTLYDIACGKIGVLVGDDFYSYEKLKAFAVCGADAIICIQKDVKKEISDILLRAYSYLLGIPVCLITDGAAAAAENTGEIIYNTAADTCCFNVRFNSEYNLITTKTRFDK